MTKQERSDFIRRVTLASKLPTVKSAALARQLLAMGPRSARLAEAACNRELWPGEDALDDRLDARVKAIGEALGLRAYRQGDPRGYTIRVVVGKALSNNWDGETVGCG